MSISGERRDALVRWGTFAAWALLLVVFHAIVARRVHFYLEQPRYSHCVLLPAVSLIWMFDRWHVLSRIPALPAWSGVVWTGVSVVLLVYGQMQHSVYLQHAALLLALPSLTAALRGWAFVRSSSFAFAYLLLTVPLHKTWDDKLTLPLQSIATRASEAAFDSFGWIVVRQGNVIQLPGLKLLVEDACSGAHSIYALVALGVAWIGFVERPLWVRVALILCTVPVAIVANTVRVVGTGILAYKVDPSYAEGASHQTAGMIVFVIGLLLFLVCDWCLKPDSVPAAPAKRDPST